jgi:NAD(P)-dependent dehydrogenase (short-subunit alcohol dehydrogenase family)
LKTVVEANVELIVEVIRESMMKRILITGANRGIGLELTRQYLAEGATVFATCRQPNSASALHELQAQYGDKLHIHALTVDDATSIQDCVQAIHAQTEALDVVINNAGIYPKTPQSQKFGDLQATDVLRVLEVNSVAPVIVSQAFVDLLRAGSNPRLVMISSGMGSIDGIQSSNGVSYRMSKAALNMAARVLGVELKPMGITTITTHPGWVQTDMGGANAAITPQASAEGLRSVIANLTLADVGKFFNVTGELLAW